MPKTDDGPMEMTFGQMFGALVREKRGQEGLTQRELAIQAFDDESKVRRIIEIEKGMIRRPQPKTIDPIVVCLHISREEMLACESRSMFSPAEQKEMGLSRALIENLALRFDHDNPDASDEELLGFLKEKAKELKTIRARLLQLESTQSSLKNSIRAATACMDQGDFDEADHILAAAEELQEQERTIAAIEAQTELRESRGDAALFATKWAVAAEHYRRAALFIVGIDQSRAVERLIDFAGRIYEMSRRSALPDFVGAIDLLDAAVDVAKDMEGTRLWVEARYDRALVSQSQARSKPNDATRLLDQAIVDATLALEASPSPEHEFDWARCSFLLANCFLARAEIVRSKRPDIDAAIDRYEQYLAQPETPIVVVHKASVLNSLVAALRIRDGIAGANTPAARQKRKMLLRKAISLSSDRNASDVWAAAQLNLALELKEEALTADPSTLGFVLTQAIAACAASLEAFPQTALTAQAASTHLLLAGLLISLGAGTRGDIRGVYLERAQSSLFACEAIFSHAAASPAYNETLLYIATICVLHAEDYPETAEQSCAEARRRLDAMLRPSKSLSANSDALYKRISQALAASKRS